MSKRTVPAEMSGFAPLFDIVTQKHGLIVSAVFGEVWRFCQMKTGKCNASQSTIAQLLGLSRQTVIKALDILVSEKYLFEQKNPGRPSDFYTTGKAGMRVKVEAFPADHDTEAGSEAEELAKFAKQNAPQTSAPVEEGVKEIDKGCEATLQPPVKQIDTNIQLNNTSNKQWAPPVLFPESEQTAEQTPEPEAVSQSEQPARSAGLWTDIVRAGRPVKNDRLHDIVAGYERRMNEQGGLDFAPSWLPEILQAHYRAFLLATNIQPLPRERKGWVAALMQFIDANVTPDYLTAAVDKLRNSGASVTDPFSVFKTARMLAQEAKSPRAAPDEVW